MYMKYNIYKYMSPTDSNKSRSTAVSFTGQWVSILNKKINTFLCWYFPFFSNFWHCWSTERNVLELNFSFMSPYIQLFRHILSKNLCRLRSLNAACLTKLPHVFRAGSDVVESAKKKKKHNKTFTTSGEN